MHLLRTILAVVFVALAPLVSFAAEPPALENQAPTAPAAEVHGDGHGEHAGLPAGAVEIHRIGPFVITNSMLVAWVVAALLIIFAQLATRNIQLIPSGLQNFWEWMVEGLYDFLQGVLGKDLVKKSFWFFGSIFIFILATNWFGVVPGVGTVGWKATLADGTTEFRPWLRGGNADLSMTAAMAILFFALWVVWSFQSLGVVGFFKHLFVGQGGGGGFMKLFISLVFLVVGMIEVISILFRPVSLSFRLYGNIFAGENILEAMMMLVPWLGWVLPLPFYVLELLVGLVQALVFTLLTAVFTALMCAHPEGHDEGHGHGKEGKGAAAPAHH